jgi:hypothetical protein
MQGKKQYQEKLITNFQLSEPIPQEDFYGFGRKFNLLNCNDNVVLIVIISLHVLTGCHNSCSILNN